MSSPSQGRNIILAIGVGSQKDRDSRPYREPLLAAAAERFPVWLFDSYEPTWQEQYTVGSTVVDCQSPEALITEANRLSASYTIVGVLCPDEGSLEAAARVTDALGALGLSADSARNCRDKKLSRALLTAEGIAQPGFTTARTWQEALSAAERFGFPVVLKPRTLGASQGVVLVREPSEMEQAFEASSRAGYPGVEVPDDYMVEEYLSGPEVSIDGVVFEGEYIPLFVAHKKVGPEPFFTEVGHVVTADDPLVSNETIRSMLEKAHGALGISHGATHSEIKLTPNGPVIVEINGRPGGDLLPYVCRLATGVDACLAAVDVVTGRAPTVRRTLSRTMGIRFYAPTEPSLVREVRIADRSDFPGVVEAAPLAAPGAELFCPPEDTVARYGYAIVEGASPGECTERLELVEGLVTLDHVPLKAAT
ncbi:ATP-grasp domain-containing protein [Nocardiopsis xinjiangensis]|uniref:ATP-grasp domain-containing protein n=1 Tax=Nocardiopsis xinjiangensis TaxID=124285 RepID=UPI000346BE0C|nr:ATP-grasp domain-containing protein [Nocardiopsis xinjiangensis]